MRSKSGPGGTFHHYGLCELAQRQAVFVRKDKPSGRAIKSDRAKVVMPAGCISRTFDISHYIYNSRKRYATRQIIISIFLRSNSIKLKQQQHINAATALRDYKDKILEL